MMDNLADTYIEYMEKIRTGEVKGMTWNDFYEYAGVPERNRSDFASAAILNQLQKKGYFK